MNNIENEILDEVFTGCGEMLEMIPLESRGEYIANVLARLLAKERKLTEHYKKVIKAAKCV